MTGAFAVSKIIKKQQNCYCHFIVYLHANSWKSVENKMLIIQKYSILYSPCHPCLNYRILLVDHLIHTIVRSSWVASPSGITNMFTASTAGRQAALKTVRVSLARPSWQPAFAFYIILYIYSNSALPFLSSPSYRLSGLFLPSPVGFPDANLDCRAWFRRFEVHFL